MVGNIKGNVVEACIFIVNKAYKGDDVAGVEVVEGCEAGVAAEL